MMSSITPVGERTRGQRWGLTAAAHVLGAVVGGALLGLSAGAIGSGLDVVFGIGWLDGDATAILVVAAAAGVAALLDRGPLATAVPTVNRQVDERWLDTYRGWVYGGGFGFQLGLGLVTMIPTWATPAMLVAMGLTASPVGGAAIGAVYGLARGLPVIATVRLSEPGRLWRFHERLEGYRIIGARLTAAGLGMVAVVGILAGGSA